jgi:RNA polymerase-binding transcription factor DksA
MEAGRARQLLERERTRLRDLRADAELSGSEEASEQDSLTELSSVDQHPADQGSETLEREQSLSVLEQLDAELADVERAFRRLEAGEYGTCELCGKPIGDARLEARPAARYCMEDQARMERELHLSSFPPGSGEDR